MPVRTQQPTPETARAQLLSSISYIFDQAQASTSNHRKNYVALYKVQTELAQYTEEVRGGKAIKLIGERKFQDEFKCLLLRVLSIKKGVASADRILKFVGGYTRFANEKGVEDKTAEDDDTDDDDGNTTSSRFTASLLMFLLDAFPAKDKNARYRSLYTVAEMISHLGEIDEDQYNALRAALMERATDKEPNVRHHAVTSLAKLAASEDPTEFDDGESILDVLIETMAYDPSPEVRRTTLMTIPVNDRTLSAVLDRTRDTDNSIRKTVYASVLEKNMMDEKDKKVMGRTHPRTLTIEQRELIVRNGLGDRDPAVRAAAASLIASWIDVIDVKIEEQDVKIEDNTKEKLESEVLSLLGLFYLGSEGTVAVDALLSIFVTRVDIFNDIEFDDQYWANLTPEKAFLARVFVDHCKSTNDEVRLEATLPVVTSIAFRIQEAYNTLVDDLVDQEMTENVNEAERDRRGDEREARELIISELLKLAVNLDYSDEIGRRKTFQLVRNMLRAEALPEALMAPCLDVLRELSSSERDLIRLVVETVQELRDSVIGDDEEEVPKEADAEKSFDGTVDEPRPVRPSVENMSPEQKARLDVVDLRCLSMCIGMLERVNSTFEENITLDGVLRGLIIPSVQRKDDAFRERGLKSLGLCCLIARRLAVQFVSLFMSHIATSPPGIRVTLVHSLVDIFMVHENVIFRDQVNNLETITKFLLTQIMEEQDPKVKAALCEGTSKLVLSGLITDVDVGHKILLKTYISPLTAGNQELRQCLTFFFQIYSHSSPANQARMREIFILIFLDICEDRKKAKESDEDSEVISSAQVAAMFVDWTDPLQLSKAINARGTQNEKSVDECIQLDIAEDILKLLFEKDLKVEIEKEDKRVLCQLFNKLHIPDTVDDYRIRSLKLLMDNLRTRRPLRDSVCNTAFTKFEATITKKFEKQLEHFSEEEFRKFEELNELFMFLDSIIPLDDDELIDIDIPKKGRKRRSESIISTTTESRSGSPAPRTSKGKSKAK
ncbi:nuclear condensing complex subunit [Flammula alnicola]|nr:nuclear condensing complex subunit [Flammula alnicola]